MVLESLLNPLTLKRRPWEMFLAGFFYSIISLFLSYMVFREIAGVLTVFLIVISVIPLLFTAVIQEENLDLEYTSEWKILKEHSKVIFFMVFLFLGVTFALVLTYILLPQPIVDSFFGMQKSAITNVNNYLQGNTTRLDIFVRIFTNNLKVLFFCLIFSLLYGMGAIFILVWNASVIAVAMGNLIKTELVKIASLVGWEVLSSYFNVATFSFFRYMTHGFFEIIAYFVMGLAGSIISIAIIKRNLDNDSVLTDILDLMLISLGFLIVAALIEVYITPALFA
ncbi:MAG: stage II sporulation protein M [Nanoarchaeota archaeon]